MKYLAAILILCSLASGADPSTGPVLSHWNIEGHTYPWQLEQIDSGLPFETTIRLPNKWELTGALKPHELAAFPQMAEHGGPLVLRMNNIREETLWTIVPPPLTAENATETHGCVIRKADGTLAYRFWNGRYVPCPFAESSVAAWREAGRTWAASRWVGEAAAILNPTGIILRENNESVNVTLGSLVAFSDQARKLNHNGVPIFQPLPDDWETRDPTEYCDHTGTPLLATDLLGPGYELGRLFYYRWKTNEQLDATVDLRAKDWLATRRHRLPESLADEFRALWIPMYQAVFAGFQENLPDNWRAVPFRTCAYNGDIAFYDAASQQTYTGYWNTPTSLTHPTFAATIAARRTAWDSDSNPNSWAEISIQLAGRSVVSGLNDGLCDVVNAESYAAFNVHSAWASHKAGREFRAVWYENYLVPPTSRITNDTMDAQLTAAGRADATGMTVGDCEVAIMQAFNEIHAHPILRDHWQRGTTAVLASANNDAAVTRVYAIESTIPGNPRTLIHVYTPCSSEQAPELYFGEHSVQWARSAYYLTNPLEPLPDDVPLSEQVERNRLEIIKIKQHLGIE